MKAMGDDAALVFYLVMLWIALLGIMAPQSSRSPVCINAKRLAAVAFVALVLDSSLKIGH
jgi:hypothetical protein